MKDGYYWVKVNHNSDWSIQKIRSGNVDFSHSNVVFPAKLLYQIGDYIETPDKYKE